MRRDPDPPADRLRSLKLYVQAIVFVVLVTYFAFWAFAHHDVTLSLRVWPWSSAELHEVRASVVVLVALGTGGLAVWRVDRIESLRQGRELRLSRAR